MDLLLRLRHCLYADDRLHLVAQQALLELCTKFRFGEPVASQQVLKGLIVRRLFECGHRGGGGRRGWRCEGPRNRRRRRRGSGLGGRTGLWRRRWIIGGLERRHRLPLLIVDVRG